MSLIYAGMPILITCTRHMMMPPLWGDHFSERELNFEPRIGNGRHAHALTLHTQCS